MASLNYPRIPPSKIAHILEFFNWSFVKEVPSKADVWRSINGTVKWLPKHNDYEDYPEIIEELISIIAEENKIRPDEAEIYFKQLYSDTDLLLLRVNAPDVKDGSIPLEDGSDLFSSIKDVLEGSLKNIKNVKQAFKDQFIDEAQLGQTAVGSYVVSIYCPLLEVSPEQDPEQESFNTIGPVAIGRKISHTILRRLETILGILEEYADEFSSECLNQLLQVGFTKKECISIEKLFGSKGHRDWDIKFIWSGKHEELSDISKVNFHHRNSTRVRKIGEQLSSLEENVEETTLMGRIFGLSRDYDEDYGAVKMKAMMGKKEVTVHLQLSDKEYQIAHEANDSRNLVTVKGDLVKIKSGRITRYFMQKIQSIKQVKQDPLNL